MRRLQAHFPFCSCSLEYCSKLVLNSCRSRAEFFTSDFFHTEINSMYEEKRVPDSEGLMDLLNFAEFRNISSRPKLNRFHYLGWTYNV